MLTAFNIESYKGLQQDPDVLSAKLLFNLTQSIHNLGFIIQGNIVNSTQSVIIPSPTFETPATYVRINILWFTSLVFSLVTAALAMLVKQWLGQFPPIEWATAQERVRARNFRHRGLIKWGVMDVATALPVFLQIALLLFLLGLSEFTRNLHPTVGWTITGLIVLWFCALLTSILAPILSARCPYKTPLLKRPLSLIRGWVFSFINAVKRETSEEVTQLLVEEEHIVEDSSQDISILVTLDDYFRNLDFLRAVQSCLSDADLDTVLQWVGGMVANRTKGDINHENLGEEICEFALYPLTKPALRLTIQTIFDASKREFNHCLRHNSQCLEDGLPCNLKTTLKLILRVALFADELVRSPSRFGAFIVELLAQNANVRKDLIDTVLSRDWFFPPSDPWITDVSCEYFTS